MWIERVPVKKGEDEWEALVVGRGFPNRAFGPRSHIGRPLHMNYCPYNIPQLIFFLLRRQADYNYREAIHSAQQSEVRPIAFGIQFEAGLQDGRDTATSPTEHLVNPDLMAREIPIKVSWRRAVDPREGLSLGESAWKNVGWKTNHVQEYIVEGLLSELESGFTEHSSIVEGQSASGRTEYYLNGVQIGTGRAESTHHQLSIALSNYDKAVFIKDEGSHSDVQMRSSVQTRVNICPALHVHQPYDHHQTAGPDFAAPANGDVSPLFRPLDITTFVNRPERQGSKALKAVPICSREVERGASSLIPLTPGSDSAPRIRDEFPIQSGAYVRRVSFSSAGESELDLR